MPYRVFDNEKKQWVYNNVYLNPDDELFLIKRSLFGMLKVPLALHQDRYVFQRDIGLYDKNDVLIFEGDYVRARVAENITKVGLVVFAHEMSAYVMLCDDSNEFYTLGSDVSSELRVIGNVFNGYDEILYE